MFYAPILLLALIAPQGEGALQGAQAWGDVELPAGFHLDLVTGLVSNQAPSEIGQGVTWDGESLRGSALLLLTPEARERAVIARGDGVIPQQGMTALKGAEWSYSVGELGWGYLRVLQVDPERIALERAHRDVRAQELIRVPTEVSWSSSEDGVKLRWDRSGAGDERWIVQRRQLKAGVSDDWSSLGVSTESSWVDAELRPDVVYEYKVLKESGGLGARVRCVAGGLFDGVFEATQGVDVNALSGELNGARSDLRVEYINPKGVQISPGDAALVRTITDTGREAWELPSSDAPGYGAQRYFISVGRDLALYLPEGLYARVSLNKIEDGKAELRVNLALDGGRVIMPTPRVKSSEWLSSGEVEVRVDAPNGYEGLGLGEPSFILEVERSFQTEEWITLPEEASGDGGVLLDLEPGESGPKRYRARLRLGDRVPSSPSDPVTVLIGDDGGEQAEGWIREAVAELGEREYLRRQRARDVLIAVGERARPLLLEVISSDNPEQASAARELLSALGELGESVDSSVAQLPEVLIKRAGELGLSSESMPLFLDPDPALRAYGALAVTDPEPLRAHLELLADADSELFVREAAGIALSLPPRRSSLEQATELEVPSLESIAQELAAYERLDVGYLADVFERAASELSAWHALIAFQVSVDLRASRGSEEAELSALKRARLVVALITQRESSEEVPASFMAAALDVVHEPLHRLDAGRAFAASRFTETELLEESLRVAAGDFADLAALLDEFRRSGQGEQLIIPSGDYEVPSGVSSSLRMGGRGVHLVGEGEVRIYGSLLIEEGSEVVLENLHISPRSGIGITLTGSELTLKNCRLTLQSMGIQATDSVVALSRSVITDPPRAASARGGAIAMRFVGMSALVAKNSQIFSGASCAHGPRFVLLDTCAFTARDRCGLEGQGSMEVIIERSLLSGGYAALSGATTGVLDGVVLDSPGHAALRVGKGLHFCIEHTKAGEETGELWTKGHALECTFEPR